MAGSARDLDMFIYWLKVACGAFSERADWLVAARGQKASFLPTR